MNNPIYLYRPGYLTTLHRHFGSLDTTLVISERPWAGATGSGRAS